MRLGEILVGRGLVSVADIDRAMDRQRGQGGRLGENLVAMGLVTEEQLEAIIRNTPMQPRTIAETGIPRGNLSELMLKFMYLQKRETVSDLSAALKVTTGIAQELVDDAMQRQLIQAVGSQTVGIMVQIRYTLSERGRLTAVEAANQNQYLGPVPVPLEAFQEQVSRQRITNEITNAEALREAFAGLVVPDHFLRKIGPAINAGRTVLLFGPPGNGKTTLATRLASIFRQTIYVPYAVEVDSQIIKIFDPSVHKRSISEDTASAMSTRNTVRREAFDERWVACKRPIVVTGGELTLEMLDLQFSSEAKYYEAPLHLKALNGTFIIDDFGRQQVSPTALLNRWIVPMESRVDYMKLNTGKSFSIPFDELIIFSTNLQPDDLMDPAFLRRIPYKIKLFEPTKAEYRQIFEGISKHAGLALTDDIFEYGCDILERYGYALAYYQPKFICDQVSAVCKYEGIPPAFTRERVAQALSNLYVRIANLAGTEGEPQ